MNPWLRYPLLALASPLLLALAVVVLFLLVAMQVVALFGAAINDDPPENVLRDFWDGVIRGR